jgi:hypothetical protein
VPEVTFNLRFESAESTDLPTWSKITLVLYGAVLVSNVALRHAVLSGAPDPGGKLIWGFALLMLALIWAVGLFVWLLIHVRELSNAERVAGLLSVGFAGVLFLVVSILWNSAGA